MTPKIETLVARLDGYAGNVELPELRECVAGLELGRQDVAPYVRYGDDCYRRNKVHAGAGYEVLVLCWRSGQRSPIHDHRGSACALVVVEGAATETVFERSGSGLIFPTGSRRLCAGKWSVSHDRDIHQMGNLEPAGADLITLHIYSPPLRNTGTYFLGDSVIGEGLFQSGWQAEGDLPLRDSDADPATLQLWPLGLV